MPFYKKARRSEIDPTEPFPFGPLDEDGLDPIQALVCDAAAAEPSRMVHEGGQYYAERIIRRAIAQGRLALGPVGMGDGPYGFKWLAEGFLPSETRCAVCGREHSGGCSYYASFESERHMCERIAASADTLPKGQDAQQGLAGTESGAVGAAETPSPSPSPAAGR